VATQPRSAQTKAKQTPLPLHKLDGTHHKPNGGGKSPHAQTHGNPREAVEDAAFTEDIERAPKGKHAGTEPFSPASLVARGKDLVSGEVGSVATAAAIVVGAALIEVELIPGIIIGAGAILLSKLFPQMGSYVRPAIKGAVRAGFSVVQKTREVVAEATEQVHDLVAEVKHEQEQPSPGKQDPTVKKPVGGDDGSPVH
jgi:hypothetical protein